MDHTDENLLSAFAPVSKEQWREVVDKARKGASFERLVSRAEDGFDIQPIYARSDWDGGDAAAGVPGAFPYRRGTTAEGRHAARWDMRQGYEHPDLATARAEIAADLARGVTSLWLRLDRSVRVGDADPAGDGLCCRSADELSTLLSDVVLDAVGLWLSSGANGVPAFAMLANVARRRGVELSRLRGGVGMDPLGALAGDGSAPYTIVESAKQAGALAKKLSADAPGLRAMTVDTTAYHDAGASAGQEIGYALATGVAYLRWLTDAGLSVDAAAGQLAFTVRVGTDLFTEVAKLRALRECWARVVQASGGGEDARQAVIHAAPSSIHETARDPWVNMLRTTTEAFSAAVGGADAITTHGFDHAVGQSDAFARRIASNAQVVLNEEAHVAHVADPAGGSYYVESLTDSLRSAGWSVLQDVEAAGGMAAALESGEVAKAVGETAGGRAATIAKRKRAITGVSEFANLAEAKVARPAAELPAPSRGVEPLSIGQDPLAGAIDALSAGASVAAVTAGLGGGGGFAIEALPVRPLAAPFEHLRDRAERHVEAGGEAPTAFLCNLGPIPSHKPRSTFATGFLHAGGIRCLDNDGFADVSAAAAAFAAAGATVAVLCGSDETYAEWSPTLLPALREAGARVIIYAGRPGDAEAGLRDAGVTHFVYMGCDVAATLADLLTQMGVA